jgi:hypothetical protein
MPPPPPLQLLLTNAATTAAVATATFVTATETALVGKSTWNSAEFRNYFDSRPFELQNFHQNFMFLIVKFVPANL